MSKLCHYAVATESDYDTLHLWELVKQLASEIQSLCILRAADLLVQIGCLVLVDDKDSDLIERERIDNSRRKRCGVEQHLQAFLGSQLHDFATLADLVLLHNPVSWSKVLKHLGGVVGSVSAVGSRIQYDAVVAGRLTDLDKRTSVALETHTKSLLSFVPCPPFSFLSVIVTSFSEMVV